MKTIKRLLSAIMILVIIAAIPVPAVAEQTAYAAKNCVQIYKKASSSSGKCGKISYGESVTFIKKKGRWAKVKNDMGAIGFCSYSSLTAKNPNKTNVTYYALSTGVNIYRHALSSSKKLKTLKKGDSVTVIATTKDGKWRRVKYDGGYGYVSSANLSKTQPEMPTVMYVCAGTSVIYKTNSTKSSKLLVLNYAESVVRRKTNGSWAKVKTAGGIVGWMKKKDLTLNDPNFEAETWYVAADSLPVRLSPSGSSQKLATLNKDDKVSVVADTPDGEWKRIALEKGNGYGFVKSAKLTSNPPVEETPLPTYDDPYKGSAGAKIENVASIAVAQYGKPYIWGTEGPDTYDCSGLMCYAFKGGAGITLQRSAYAQGYDGSFQKITDVAKLKRGDIVCFNTVEADEDMSDHTGLYLGGGNFIHASSGQGEVVVSTLKEGYYSRAFSWGLRIIP